MEAIHKNVAEIERRHSSPNRQALNYRLSMNQKHSINNLSQYGYQLTYLRNTEEGGLAVLMCGDNIATVDAQGDIDTSPDIAVRD